jgi:hypothetical protein
MEGGFSNEMDTTMTDLDMLKQLITLSFFVLSVFTLFVAIKYGKKSKYLFILVPLVLTLAISTSYSISKILGYPVEVVTSNEQMYLYHTLSRDRKWIYVWTVDSEAGMPPRAYKIPYTSEDEKKVEEAKEKKKAGVPQAVVLPEGTAESSDALLQVYDFNKTKGVQKT